jgi:hypothetical protein
METCRKRKLANLDYCIGLLTIVAALQAIAAGPPSARVCVARLGSNRSGYRSASCQSRRLNHRPLGHKKLGRLEPMSCHVKRQFEFAVCSEPS